MECPNCKTGIELRNGFQQNLEGWYCSVCKRVYDENLKHIGMLVTKTVQHISKFALECDTKPEIEQKPILLSDATIEQVYEEFKKRNIIFHFTFSSQ